MKEIKLRLWDKVNKRMLFFANLGWHEEYNLLYFSEGELDVPCKDNMEIMQFTGLKDKNGKEIYEGDMLRFYVDEGFDDGEYLGEVIFVNGCFSVKISDQRKNPKINNLYKYDVGQIIDVCEFEKCEIIGNIYENPELSEGIQ